MKKLFCLLLLLFSCLFGLFALSGQDIIPLSSSLYANMDDLYLILGIGTPSDSRPWSKNEAKAILDVVDGSLLSGSTKRLYEQVKSEVEKDLRWTFPDKFSLGAFMDVSGEMYAHTNTNTENGFTSYEDWLYGYTKRKPLLRLRLDMAVSDFFYTYCDLQYGYGIVSYDDTLSQFDTATMAVGALGIADGVTYVDGSSLLSQYTRSFSTNLITAARDFDFDWPKRAVFSVGGKKWNFNVSRDRISWGNSHIGNFILDDHLDFNEYARFTVFTDYFKYESTVVFMDSIVKESSNPDEKFRMLLAHRLEFRPWRKVTLAVSENVMYQNDVWDFRYLNPAFIYHNLNNVSMFNAIAHAELSYTPVPGLNFYGQVVLDQAKAPNDSSADSDAWGVLGGVDFGTALGKGILTSSFEGAMTLPCLYRRDGVDFLVSRRYDTLKYFYVFKFDYLGFPYGGDALVFKLDTSYRIPQAMEVGFSVTAMWHGEMSIYTLHNSKGNGYTPVYGSSLFIGDVITNTWMYSLKCSYDLKNVLKWPSITLYGELDYITIVEYSQSSKQYDNYRDDVQLTVGTTIAL
ncbi:MAG: hypothetical protein WCR02_10860 [Sphaerochaetaceae bacterium]